MRFSCYLGWVVMGLGCSDASLKTFNDAPTAQILSHSDGEELIEAPTTDLFGQVADTTHDALELSATWYVNGETACAGAAPTDDGYTQCETTLPTGEVRILLEVTDPGGASGKDSVTLDISPSEPPEVTLNDPNASGTYYADEPIPFAGQAVDAEDTFEQLTVSLASDLDGALDVDTTLNADGDFSTYGYLTQGTHVITLTAVDSSGKSGETNQVVSVGPSRPPVASLYTPDGSEEYFADIPILFTGHAEDTEDSFEALSVALASDRDGELGLDFALNAAGDFSVYGYLSEGTHIITLSATDTAGKSGTADQVVTVGAANQAPVMVSVEITPDTGVTVATTLTCTATVTDPDGDTLTVDYSWSRDGLVLGTGDAIALNGTGTTRGDTITCTATATDPDGENATDTDTVTVENAAPEISVSLTPAVVYTNDTLTAVVTAGDLDDDPVSTTLQWYVNSVTVGETGPTLSGVDHFDKHDEVYVVATATDGTEDGGPATSGTVVVRNTTPTAPALAFVPEDPITGEEAQCVIDTLSTDEDEDAISYAFSWDVDGTAYTVAGTTDEVGDTLVEGDSETNDLWTCTVIPADDDASGASAEVSVVTCPAVLEFDGVDDIVTLPNVDDTPGDLTMEAWVKLYEPPENQTLIMSSECAHLWVTPTELWIGTWDDCIQTDACDQGYTNCTSWVEAYTPGNDGGFLYTGWDGTWKHIAVTVNARHGAEMFVDGVSIGTAVLSRDSCMSGATRSNLGRARSGGTAIDGQFANVRYSNAVIYDSTFTPDYPMEELDSTVLLYGLQQDMRTGSLTDESDMDYDGTIVDATWTTGGPDCDE